MPEKVYAEGAQNLSRRMKCMIKRYVYELDVLKTM